MLKSLSIFIGILILFSFASFDIGLTWDESIYFRYSDSILEWFFRHCSFEAKALQQYWNYDAYSNPHPPLFKIISAGTHYFFKGILPFPLDYRLGHFLFISGSLTLFYSLLQKRLSPFVSMSVLLFAFLQPRLWGDLLIAATDSICAVVWFGTFLVVWAIEQEETPQGKKKLWCFLYVLLAIGFATKLTAALVYLPIYVYFLGTKKWKSLNALTGSLMISLLFFVFCDPSHWRDPVARLIEYVYQPAQRLNIPISTFYLGESVFSQNVPWHYFLVMSLITTPTVLCFGVLGWKNMSLELKSLSRFCWAGMLFWTLLESIPSVPKHDGVRQFAAFFPFLGAACGLGFASLLKKMKPMWKALPIIGLFGSLLFSRPYHLSYYNLWAGGLSGAESLGMETSYWLESAWPRMIHSSNQLLPKSATLSILPAWLPLLERYQSEGLLRSDIQLKKNALSDADYLILIRRRSAVEDSLYLSTPAIAEERFHGVSLSKLIKIERRKS